MTTYVQRELSDTASAPPRAGAHPLDGKRAFVRLTRSLSLRGREVAELRWAAVSLVAMAGLSLLAKLIDPMDPAYDRAVLVTVPAAALALAAGWAPWGARFVRRPIAA